MLKSALFRREKKQVDTARRAAPWHLWVVGIVTLLWNCLGAYDYIMSQTRNVECMRAMMEPYGMDAQVAADYFAGFPVWADAAWAIGVWGSMLGSVLLLLRSRYALHAFIASLLGLLGSVIHQLSDPLPGISGSPMAIGMTVAVAIVIVLLAWYARAMTRRGVLR